MKTKQVSEIPTLGFHVEGKYKKVDFMVIIRENRLLEVRAMIGQLLPIWGSFKYLKQIDKKTLLSFFGIEESIVNRQELLDFMSKQTDAKFMKEYHVYISDMANLPPATCFKHMLTILDKVRGRISPSELKEHIDSTTLPNKRGDDLWENIWQPFLVELGKRILPDLKRIKQLLISATSPQWQVSKGHQWDMYIREFDKDEIEICIEEVLSPNGHFMRYKFFMVDEELTLEWDTTDEVWNPSDVQFKEQCLAAGCLLTHGLHQNITLYNLMNRKKRISCNGKNDDNREFVKSSKINTKNI
jgi:hypothetical protein